MVRRAACAILAAAAGSFVAYQWSSRGATHVSPPTRIGGHAALLEIREEPAAPPRPIASDEGRIVGGVFAGVALDDESAAAASVEVTLRKHREDRILRRAVTDGDGAFTFSDVAPDAYDVTASGPGYARLVRQGLTIASAQR